MRLKTTAVLICLLFVLTGCDEEIITPEPTYLHSITTYTVWDNHAFQDISPVSAFENTEDSLKVFPYFNSTEYILIERIYISDNNFWESVTQQYIGTPNYVETDNYSYFTLAGGVTLGLVPIAEDECYFVKTDSLSSAYVEKVCELLCK